MRSRLSLFPGDDVTLVADRTVLAANGQVRLRGAISPERAAETVEIEVKDCGQPSFRQVAGTATDQGGQWAVEYRPAISATVCAAWKGQRSAPIAIQHRAAVSIVRAVVPSSQARPCYLAGVSPTQRA